MNPSETSEVIAAKKLSEAGKISTAGKTASEESYEFED